MFDSLDRKIKELRDSAINSGVAVRECPIISGKFFESLVYQSTAGSRGLGDIYTLVLVCENETVAAVIFERLVSVVDINLAECETRKRPRCIARIINLDARTSPIVKVEMVATSGAEAYWAVLNIVETCRGAVAFGGLYRNYDSAKMSWLPQVFSRQCEVADTLEDSVSNSVESLLTDFVNLVNLEEWEPELVQEVVGNTTIASANVASVCQEVCKVLEDYRVSQQTSNEALCNCAFSLVYNRDSLSVFDFDVARTLLCTMLHFVSLEGSSRHIGRRVLNSVAKKIAKLILNRQLVGYAPPTVNSLEMWR